MRNLRAQKAHTAPSFAYHSRAASTLLCALATPVFFALAIVCGTQFTVVEALSQVVFGCVYIIKVQVVAPPSNQYAGARPAKSPTPENLLLRVWAKTDGKFVLEGMVKGRGADQLRYFEKNTFEGMVLRGRPG